MTDGSSVTLAVTDTPDDVDAGVTSVAISSDGQLVAAGCLDTVRNFFQLIVTCITNTVFNRWYVSGTLVPVNCWRGCGDTDSACTVWHSPPMDVGW